jgi:cysteinyl-tRNA synthetase
MTTIRLHNTRTRRKEDFRPIDPSNVRMYVCGPTVYDRAHLGNARPVVVFDVLYRLLRHVYGPDHVTYVRNFTDVDDKINDTALARQQAGDPRPLVDLIRERTDETIAWYHADMDALGALRPTHEPRATDFIGQMIAMIAGLVAGGHAYAKEGHVLFRVRSYRDYGRLSGRSVDDMIAGARVEVAPFKEDPMDFVLWKPSGDDLPGWDSPWGRGRPGWHIECSAMAEELLWLQPSADGKLSPEALRHPHTFDIHAGGIDLQFPHHENEIAQSMCAHPKGEFARVWLHNEMLQVEGKKMSKSLGNFFTVRDLLDKGVPGEVIRFVMLMTHYSKPMDWTEKKREEAERTLEGWYNLTDGVEADTSYVWWVADELGEDLNTHAALAKLHELATPGSAAQLKGAMRLLGFPDAEDVAWFRTSIVTLASVSATSDTPLYLSEISPFLRRLQELRLEKRYDEADALRSKLEQAGLQVSIGAGGPQATVPRGFIPSKLEALK